MGYGICRVCNALVRGRYSVKQCHGCGSNVSTGLQAEEVASDLYARWMRARNGKEILREFVRDFHYEYEGRTLVDPALQELYDRASKALAETGE